jgi:hypothetical protein
MELMKQPIRGADEANHPLSVFCPHADKRKWEELSRVEQEAARSLHVSPSQRPDLWKACQVLLYPFLACAPPKPPGQSSGV